MSATLDHHEEVASHTSLTRKTLKVLESVMSILDTTLVQSHKKIIKKIILIVTCEVAQWIKGTCHQSEVQALDPHGGKRK